MKRRTVSEVIKRYAQRAQAAQHALDDGRSDHEVLGALWGIPPEAIAFVETRQTILVLAGKIGRWWSSLTEAQRPPYMTMRQFQTMFGGAGVGAWQLGNALRHLSWTSSRRSWKENGPRSRVWVPPC